MAATDIAIISTEVIIRGTDAFRNTTTILTITSGIFIDGVDGYGGSAELMYLMVMMLVMVRPMVIVMMLSIARKTTMRTMQRTIVATIATMLPRMIGRANGFMTVWMTMGLRLRSKG